MRTVTVGGIEFEVVFSYEPPQVKTFDQEGFDAEVYIEEVYVGCVDITEIISREWITKLEDAVLKDIDRERNDYVLEAELDRLEAWGV